MAASVDWQGQPWRPPTCTAWYRPFYKLAGSGGGATALLHGFHLLNADFAFFNLAVIPPRSEVLIFGAGRIEPPNTAAVSPGVRQIRMRRDRFIAA